MALDDVLDLLTCPVCGGGLARDGGSLGCDSGHRFDVARQGFATLAAGALRHPGDTPEQVMARERVQGAGVLDEVVAAVVDAAAVVAGASNGNPVLADVGAGIGTYAVAVLHRGLVDRGIALDASKPALRRAARAHPRLAAIGCDLTAGIPLRDGAVDLVLVAFAPRGAGALHRILAPRGSLVVVTPQPDHLDGIAGPLGLLEVPAGKAEEVAAALVRPGDEVTRVEVRATRTVDRGLAVDLAQMGPAGVHATRDELESRAAALGDAVEVGIAVNVTRIGPTAPAGR